MTMTSPLRGPKSAEGGGFAAAHLPGTPRRVRGRPSGPKAAAHRLRRRPAGCPGPRRPLRPLGPGEAGRPRPAPALRAARNPPRWRAYASHPDPKETDELAFDTRKEENLRYHSRTLESVKHHLK